MKIPASLPRRLTVLVLLSIGLAACDPVTPDRPPASAAFGLSIDGLPVRCDVETTHAVGAEPTVEVALAPGAALSARLDGAAIADRFDGDGLRRAHLALAPGVHALEIAVEAGGDARRCALDLTFRPSLAEAEAALEGASSSPLRTTRSSETGAIADAVLSVPTTGSTPRERADDFVTRFGEAFGADPGGLRFGRERLLSDGWSVVEYQQWVRDARAFRAGLTVTLDADGSARLVHARLVSDDAALGVHASNAGAVEDIAGAMDLGTVLGVERVFYDVRRPKPGWWVEGVGASALLDDATGDRIERRTNVFADGQVELARAEPADWAVRDLVTAGGLVGPTVALEGPTGGLPIPVDGQTSSASDETLWLHLTDASDYAFEAFGVEGFADWSNASTEPTWASRAPGTSRVIAKDTPLANAFYSSHWDAMFFGSDLRHPDVVCHELGHALHFHQAGEAVTATFFEALADAFMIGCEGALDPSRDRYSIQGDASLGVDEVRNIAARTNALGGVYGDYDAFLATGLEEATLADAYALTFVLTHAIYQMHETHALAHRTVAAMVWEAMSWGNVTTYAQLRDRWMATAAAWAESGRNDYSAEIVCAMAQAFRATELDGEYGVGAACAADAEGVDLVCTASHCPVCPDADAPGESVCPPETLEGDAPTCETAGGYPTCVGSLAVSADGCGDGEGRHCWCAETAEGGAAWDCSLAGACRTLPDLARAYCPEAMHPAGAADEPGPTDGM